MCSSFCILRKYKHFHYANSMIAQSENLLDYFPHSAYSANTLNFNPRTWQIGSSIVPASHSLNMQASFWCVARVQSFYRVNALSFCPYVASVHSFILPNWQVHIVSFCLCSQCVQLNSVCVTNAHSHSTDVVSAHDFIPENMENAHN